jgi:8-oxo-dGTP pyrophosphatase MutT (NUDIX family)
LTGSALLVNPTLSKVMLTHHRKLEMWLQLGGHADGHPIIHEVALNEALEESGLNHLSFLKYETELFQVHTATPLPFDLDCHVIPANSKDPEHLHYDVRFIILANDETPPAISDESLDVRWFSLEEARTITSEVSMHRQFDKLEHIRQSLRIN